VASAPILLVLGRIFKVSGYWHVTLAALLVSFAGMVVPVRGFPPSQSGFDKPMNLLSHKVIQSFANKIDKADYRVDFRDKAFPYALWAMNASYYGIKSFYNQLTPQPYDQAHFGLLINIPHLREMMGARYVLCGPDSLPLERSASEIWEMDGYRLYENPNPMGRLTLLHRVAGVSGTGDEFLARVRAGFDYFSKAYMDPEQLKQARSFLARSRTASAAQDRIEKIVDRPNQSYSEVESDSPSLLILNEWFTPAWKVRVNGKKEPVLRVNRWQTGVLLPAGKNRVEFEYRPTLFRALMALHRITFVLLLLFAIFILLRKARDAGSNRQSANPICG
jgi:hypothetical protein